MTAYEAAAAVVDPELPAVTVAELGILRSVDTDGGRVVVTITPTYTACPAIDAIRADLAAALRAAGWSRVDIITQLSPPWTTEWISESGRAKLAAAGIAPPASLGSGQGDSGEGGSVRGGSGRRLPLADRPALPAPACPQCGSAETDQLSRFGSTACQSLWRCRTCAEPFPHLKAH